MNSQFVIACQEKFSHSLIWGLDETQDKRLKVCLNGKRTITGTLRGYDAFLNVVLEEVESESGEYLGQVVIRGNSIIQFEGLDRVAASAET
jgi:small nuclear ribonucleoprotein G